MPRVLDEILAVKRGEIESLHARADLDEPRGSPIQRDFAAALRRPGLAIIAEIKRRSPSKGLLRPNLDPADLASAYERGGAAAISCLTDTHFFGAQPDDFPMARAAVTLPVLRKDFLIDAAQVVQSRRLGADAILLIARVLTDARLRALREHAESLGMSALVEVHDAGDLDRALAAGATIIGVNNRDLDTLVVDRGTALRLRPRIPPGILCVVESGLSTPGDLRAAAFAGFDAVLMGESLLRRADPGAGLAVLRGVLKRLAPAARGAEDAR